MAYEQITNEQFGVLHRVCGDKRKRPYGLLNKISRRTLKRELEFKMVKKFFSLGMMVFIFVLLFDSCATLFNNKQNTVSAASGSKSEVTILENGSVVYQGPLPATIDVKSSFKDKYEYEVQYKDKDGNSQTLKLQKRMSGWFVADILLAVPGFVDMLTGNMMVYDKTTELPITYSGTQQVILVDYIPDGLREDFRIIGNIYQ
jgi:hypothetical protein